MARLDEDIDQNSIEPRDNFDPLPNGVYEVEITDSANEANSKGTGKIAKLEYVVISGDFQGRRLWSNHNYKNHSEVAQRIALQELGEIAAAVGHRGPISDMADFYKIPLLAKVIFVPAQGQFNEKNEIKKWMPIDDAGGQQPQRPAPRRDAPQQQRQQPRQDDRGGRQQGGGGTQGARPWRGAAGGGGQQRQQAPAQRQDDRRQSAPIDDDIPF